MVKVQLVWLMIGNQRNFPGKSGTILSYACCGIGARPKWIQVTIDDGMLKRLVEYDDGSAKRKQQLIPMSKTSKFCSSFTIVQQEGTWEKTLEKAWNRFAWVNLKGDIRY